MYTSHMIISNIIISDRNRMYNKIIQVIDTTLIKTKELSLACGNNQTKLGILTLLI